VRFSREEPAQTLERWIALPTGSPFPGLESEQITMKNGNDVLSQVFPDGEFLMFFMWTGFHSIASNREFIADTRDAGARLRSEEC
jgi:hypothetical protein